MNKTMKVWIIRTAIVFGILFIIQILYQSLSHTDRPRSQLLQSSMYESARKNYAGHSLQAQSGSDRYEKIAAMALRTTSFEEDRKSILKIVAGQNGIIQFEKLQNNPPDRTYNIQIGVSPHKFDDITESLRNLSTVLAISIEKNDRTSEYIEKLAAKEALIQARQSLLALKQRPGSMEELMKLEDRLLELENQIRQASLAAGQFQTDQELCTVRITLHEASLLSDAAEIITDSFLWTIALAVALGIIAGGLAFAFYVLMLLKPWAEKLAKPSEKQDD